MPRPHPPEFRQRAVDLARLKGKPVAQIAEDLGISGSCLRGWMKRVDLDEGRRADGLTTAERDELVKLRRELRVAKLENEILKRAAYFAAENVIPNRSTPSSPSAASTFRSGHVARGDGGVTLGVLTTTVIASHRRRTD